MADSTGNRKRRRADAKQSLQHGSRGSGRKRQDMGHKDWNRQPHDRRAENSERAARRHQAEDGASNDVGALPAFSKDEIDSEGRRPKHKVAVMIGYSGTGYKGMQINNLEKTIEGDLFTAFVAAGAISKANADDPKKSALVRCARTDKGVHAAGNVISLKLIIEGPDMVSKINNHLSPQIRVWGIQRTVNSFSCYQACDSRWYEYLIPSHAFLPPHPATYLAKQIAQSAEYTKDSAALGKRQSDVADFWAMVEENSIRPITNALDESIKDLVLKALSDASTDDESDTVVQKNSTNIELPKLPPEPEDVRLKSATDTISVSTQASVWKDLDLLEAATPSEAKVIPTEHTTLSTTGTNQLNAAGVVPATVRAEAVMNTTKAQTNDESILPGGVTDSAAGHSMQETEAGEPHILSDKPSSRKQAIDKAIKSLREAYMTAKRSYRISSDRLECIALALEPFVGTKNFHNYTIEKTFKDPSAKRHIKSFQLNRKPIVMNGTEWLSLKIHGQSFMMHQIRKMVSMVALTVRCGCPASRISETLGPDIVSIPKAPGLGLLLERPVFDSYNENIASKFGREKIDFGKYEEELLEFKRREIYERIFREEEQTGTFQVFFNQVDAFKEPQFLYLTSRGLEAVKNIARRRTVPRGLQALDSGAESVDEGSA